jgi:hypothetical protein
MIHNKGKVAFGVYRVPVVPYESLNSSHYNIRRVFLHLNWE